MSRYSTTELGCVLVEDLMLLPSCVTLALQCPNGTVFSNCGTECPLTCDAPEPVACTRICVRGCFCPEGMLQRDDKCVAPDQCNGTVTCCYLLC